MVSGSLSEWHESSSHWGEQAGFQVWRVAKNVLENKLLAAEKGWS